MQNLINAKLKYRLVPRLSSNTNVGATPLWSPFRRADTGVRPYTDNALKSNCIATPAEAFDAAEEFFLILCAMIFAADLDAADKVRIGESNYNISNLTVGVAQNRGFLNKRGSMRKSSA